MEKRKGNLALKICSHVLSAVFIALCLLVIFFNFSHEYHLVDGDSMLPTLNCESTDGVFVSKIKPYSRGDIIVCNAQNEKGEDIMVIKRLIAVGGDKLTIREINQRNRIVIIYAGQTTETILNEPYLPNYDVNKDLLTKFLNMANYSMLVGSDGFITLAEDQIFYLGDNRIRSRDCSDYGPKKTTDVIGKVDYIAYGNKHVYWQVIKQVFGG